MININDGQPTKWHKDKNSIINHYHVDTLWMNEEMANHIKVHHNFDNNIMITNHYPNNIIIQHIGSSSSDKIPGFEWKINNASKSQW